MPRVRRREVLNYLLQVISDKGLFDIPRVINPRMLTVLNYHRINDIYQDSFYSFKQNVSASQYDFALQMEYLKKKYNIINCEQLAAWVDGHFELPQYAAMVTFDDGYYDNLANAYPILKALDIPAIIFLTTDFIGATEPFYWDYVAYCFSRTNKNSVNLPIIGNIAWANPHELDRTMNYWIFELKQIPDAKKQKFVKELADILEVDVKGDAFSDLYLDWDQVRQMSNGGIEFGSHTASHPILTRVTLERVETELQKSKEKIEKEIGKSVIAFAYPNGQRGDFSPEIINLVRRSGNKIAFSLLPGPTRHSTVRKNPFAIRRIYIGNKDTFPRFVAKLGGVSKVLDW